VRAVDRTADCTLHGWRARHTRGKPIRESLLERFGLRVDASRPCVEIEGAWLGTAIEACPVVGREK